MEAITLSEKMAQDQKVRVELAVKKEGRRLLGFIRKRVKNEEDANDILQDVYLSLASAVEPIEQMTAWLFRVARNRITDLYRKKKTEKLDDLFFSDENGDEDISLHWEELLPSVDSAETAWLRDALWEHLVKSLDELPAEQAWVFAKHELEGVSFKALAAESGEPVPTLISRKRYAILQLREKLSAFYDELINE